MTAWLQSIFGKLILVNLGVVIAILIGYRNGYRGTDLAVLGIVVFCVGNVGAVIGIIIGKTSKPSPIAKGSNWVWILIALTWLVYLLYALFPAKK
jgi:hypothetical protein